MALNTPTPEPGWALEAKRLVRVGFRLAVVVAHGAAGSKIAQALSGAEALEPVTIALITASGAFVVGVHAYMEGLRDTR